MRVLVAISLTITHIKANERKDKAALQRKRLSSC